MDLRALGGTRRLSRGYGQQGYACTAAVGCFLRSSPVRSVLAMCVQIGDAAHGGQVVLSHDAWVALRGRMARAGFPVVHCLGLYQLQVRMYACVCVCEAGAGRGEGGGLLVTALQLLEQHMLAIAMITLVHLVRVLMSALSPHADTASALLAVSRDQGGWQAVGPCVWPAAWCDVRVGPTHGPATACADVSS